MSSSRSTYTCNGCGVSFYEPSGPVSSGSTPTHNDSLLETSIQIASAAVSYAKNTFMAWDNSYDGYSENDKQTRTQALHFIKDVYCEKGLHLTDVPADSTLLNQLYAYLKTSLDDSTQKTTTATTIIESLNDAAIHHDDIHKALVAVRTKPLSNIKTYRDHAKHNIDTAIAVEAIILFMSDPQSDVHTTPEYCSADFKRLLLADFNAQLTEKKNEIVTKDDTIAVLTAASTASGSAKAETITKLTENIDTLTKEKNAAITLKDAKTAEVDTLNATIQKQEGENIVLTKSIEAEKKTSAQLQTDLAHLQTDLSSAKAGKSEAEIKLEAKELTLAEKTAYISNIDDILHEYAGSTIPAKISDLKDTLTKKVENLTETQTQTQAELASQQAKNTSLLTENGLKDAKIADLEARLSALSGAQSDSQGVPSLPVGLASPSSTLSSSSEPTSGDAGSSQGSPSVATDTGVVEILKKNVLYIAQKRIKEKKIVFLLKSDNENSKNLGQITKIEPSNETGKKKFDVFVKDNPNAIQITVGNRDYSLSSSSSLDDRIFKELNKNQTISNVNELIGPITESVIESLSETQIKTDESHFVYEYNSQTNEYTPIGVFLEYKDGALWIAKSELQMPSSPHHQDPNKYSLVKYNKNNKYFKKDAFTLAVATKLQEAVDSNLSEGGSKPPEGGSKTPEGGSKPPEGGFKTLPDEAFADWDIDMAKKFEGKGKKIMVFSKKKEQIGWFAGLKGDTWLNGGKDISIKPLKEIKGGSKFSKGQLVLAADVATLETKDLFFM